MQFLAHLFGENRLPLNIYKFIGDKVVYELVDENLIFFFLNVSLLVVKYFWKT